MVVIVLAFESTFLNVVWFKKDSNTPKLNWNVTLQEARIYFTQFRFMSYILVIEKKLIRNKRYWKIPASYDLEGQSWWYCSWIYNYLCNQCLSPLTLWVRITLRRGVLDTTLCDKDCQWLSDRSVVFSKYSGFLHQ
jgi:hypothetical protein